MNYFLLMAGQPSGQGGASSLLVSLVPMLLIIVIFYLLLIRPQQKKQKEHQKLISALKKGDRVITNCGMFGVISSINEDKNIIVLKVAEEIKVEFLKTSIAGKVE